MSAVPSASSEHDLPPSTLGGRVRFWVGALWLGVVTIVFSFVQFVSHQFNPTARNFKRWATPWGRLILRGFGVRVEVEEQEELDPEAPYVFVANHQNLLDIFALAAAVPYPFGFVAKAELARIPFLGFALRHSACLFVDRGDPRRALQSLKEAGRQIRDGHSVLMYPEGSRSHSPQLLAFKKGAFRLAVEAGVPIVPVTVQGAHRLLDERTHTARPGTMRIVVGRPLPTSEPEEDIPALISTVREQMGAALEREG